MKENLLTFQKFRDRKSAVDLSSFLKGKGIACQIEDVSPVLDPLLIGNSSESDYLVKIRPEDFNKTSELLEEFYKDQFEPVEEDYYLLDFSDEELEEIIQKPDEWGIYDYLL